MNALRMYFRYVGISFRTQLQYNASFWMLVAGNTVNAALEFFTMVAFFNRFGGLEEWRLPEVLLFFGMANMSFAICEAWMRGFDSFQNMVKHAEFDRVLVRPRSTVLQVLGSNFQLMRIGRFSVAIVAIVWGMRELHLIWGAGEWLLFTASILGGAVLFSGVILVQATSCFWTVETLEVFNTVTYGGIDTCQYPVSIYDEWLKRFFMYIIPLSAINYWPCSVLLGRGYVPPILAWLSPIIGPVFYGLGILIWRFGVKHYRSTGS